MNFEGFENYLHQKGVVTELEVREIISRVSWIETTMNISLDQLVEEKKTVEDFREPLLEIIGSKEKTDDFYQAVLAYYEYYHSLEENNK
jgi:hypothetical protein